VETEARIEDKGFCHPHTPIRWRVRWLPMATKTLFLASSSELKADRQEFEIFINRKNKAWHEKGIFLDLILWEDFLEAVSRTRLQDEYNQAIRDCDIFVMLFATQVGQYTAEEFETAFGQFKKTNKPFIFTYFKDTPTSTGQAHREDLMSLWAFQDRLKALGHFYTVYTTTEGLLLHFTQQLDKLADKGFIELKMDEAELLPSGVHVVIQDSKNVVQGSSVNTGGGNFILGENTTPHK
jgi:hypothetical protein